MLPLYRIGLGAALAVPVRPDASEHGERSRLIECKPGWRLLRFGIVVLAE